MTETRTVVKGAAPHLPACSEVLSGWRWIVAAMMLAVVTTGFFDRISVAVLFTNVGFNTDMATGGRPEVLGMLMTAFLLAYALSALFLSVVGDLLGPRKALGAAAGLWGLFMIGMGSSWSYGQMLALRVALGTSEGPQFSLISKTIRRWFPAHEQGRANAIWMVGSPLGSAIGFPLTLWLVSQYGWRASFYVLGLLNLLIVMPLVFAIVRNAPDETVGSETVSMAPLAWADVRALFRDPRVVMLSIYSAGTLTYLWGLNGWLPTYLHQVRHFDLRQMGVYSSLPFVLMFLGEVLSGLLADRFGRRALLSVTGLFTAGALLFLATKVADPQAAAILIAFSAGAWGLCLPAQYALALQALPRGATATGIGIINGVGNLVGACAPVTIGWIVAQTGSFQSGLLVIVLASCVGALALVPLVRSH